MTVREAPNLHKNGMDIGIAQEHSQQGERAPCVLQSSRPKPQCNKARKYPKRLNHAHYSAIVYPFAENSHSYQGDNSRSSRGYGE